MNLDVTSRSKWFGEPDYDSVMWWFTNAHLTSDWIVGWLALGIRPGLVSCPTRLSGEQRNIAQPGARPGQVGHSSEL